ncbi:MAG TPA: response regulator transcription factor [Polyangiaceae bacterium]|nr:response regulator transcription factor [Polyangiaceae bacterium]
MRVLVVDDHAELLDLVGRALARDGHSVLTAQSAAEARTALAQNTVDLLVLDLGLPDGSGQDLCRSVRKSGNAAPILVLTAQSAVSSRVECLDAGADDYLSKPFAVAELRARVRALGRRAVSVRTFVYERNGIFLDFAARRARVNGEEAPVTAREWSILELLAARSGRVVNRAEVLESVWGEVTDATSASLEVLVARIRRKLSSNVIRTVRGEGYALGD